LNHKILFSQKLECLGGHGPEKGRNEIYSHLLSDNRNGGETGGTAQGKITGTGMMLFRIYCIFPHGLKNNLLSGSENSIHNTPWNGHHDGQPQGGQKSFCIKITPELINDLNDDRIGHRAGDDPQVNQPEDSEPGNVQEP
jgi:hypothetical protein